MSAIPASRDDFYAELTARNRGLIDPGLQDALRRTRIVIAGCGSTGGACAMPLLRTGAEHFLLLDPGSYELNNLNRQDATLADIGVNKARATRERLRAVNPHADIELQEEGVDSDATASLLAGDIVIDAIDVTTTEGVRAKLALHEAACRTHLSVITAYDIATTQFIEVYDYKRVRRPLRGRVHGSTTPEGVLRSLIPPLVLPREIFPELLAHKADPERGFPQLAMTSTLLGALIVTYVLRIIGGRPVRTRLRVDLKDLVRPPLQRGLARARRDAELPALWWNLRD